MESTCNLWKNYTLPLIYPLSKYFVSCILCFSTGLWNHPSRPHVYIMNHFSSPYSINHSAVRNTHTRLSQLASQNRPPAAGAIKTNSASWNIALHFIITLIFPYQGPNYTPNLTLLLVGVTPERFVWFLKTLMAQLEESGPARCSSPQSRRRDNYAQQL